MANGMILGSSRRFWLPVSLKWEGGLYWAWAAPHPGQAAVLGKAVD